MTGLLRISAGQKRADALLHLRQRLLHTGDVLTARYRTELGYPALPPMLSDDDRKALAEWRMPPLSTYF